MMLSNIKPKENMFLINKKDLFYKIIFILIGVISTIITLVGSFSISNNQYQFLLPFCYTISYIILAPSINRLGLGYFVLNIVWLIRYALMPMLYLLTNFSMPQVTDKYLLIALFIMILELLITFVAVRFYFNKYTKRYPNRRMTKTNEKENILKNINSNLILGFLIFSLLIIVIDPNALSGFNFIFGESFSRRSSANFGIFVMVLNWTKYLLTVFLMCYFGNKYRKEKNTYNIILAFIIMVISMSVFQGTSRNGILIEAIAYLAVLIRLFPKHRKKIIILTSSGIFVLMLTITLYRFYDTRELSEAINIFNIETSTPMLNAYFSGQYNVAIGVKTLDLFWNQYGVQTVLKDIFANTIILNKIVTDIPGTVDYFNYSYYGHSLWEDQISPLITQTIGLFNVFGLLIPVFIIKVIIRMDTLTLKGSNVLGIFITALIATNLAFYSHGNLTIISTTILNKLLPLYLVYKISKYNFKKELS